MPSSSAHDNDKSGTHVRIHVQAQLRIPIADRERQLHLSLHALFDIESNTVLAYKLLKQKFNCIDDFDFSLCKV